MVLHCRAIEECLASFRAVDMDVGWLTGFSEPQLAEAMSQLVESTEYAHYIVTADDTVISQKALDAVCGLLHDGHPVVTGYCPLDATSPLVNITKRPLPSPIPSVVSYEFWKRIEAQTWPLPALRTGFAGMALTGMSRELWQRFGMKVSPLGFQTDYALSYALQEAGIPIVAAREGMVEHVKETWNYPDKEPRKGLLVGQIEASVWLEPSVSSDARSESAAR